VSFSEAATAFGDPLSITIPDPDHSIEERRRLTIGLSDRFRAVIVAHTERGNRIRIISARPLTNEERERYEEEIQMNDELRPEYDLPKLFKRGVRGKYAKRYRAGTSLVLLEPDVAKCFLAR
jgi:uncharacterized DUF497 family protein